MKKFALGLIGMMFIAQMANAYTLDGGMDYQPQSIIEQQKEAQDKDVLLARLDALIEANQQSNLLMSQILMAMQKT